MASIAYDIGPIVHNELGPGILRRRRTPEIFEWVGKNPEPSNQPQRNRFARMAYNASWDWWVKLNNAKRLLWYDRVERIHHRRPGNAGNNMHVQPYARFMTAAGYNHYWSDPQNNDGPSLYIAHIDAIAISAYHATPPSIDLTVTIDATGTASPPVMLDVYHLRPAHGLPWVSWACFKHARHFEEVVSGIHTYVINVPLVHLQPPLSPIIIWARLRNGQDANDYSLLQWQLT